MKENIFPITLKVPFFSVWFTWRWNPSCCTGAKMLRRHLRANGIKPTEVVWGTTIGSFDFNNQYYCIESTHDMTDVRPGDQITLTLIR